MEQEKLEHAESSKLKPKWTVTSSSGSEYVINKESKPYTTSLLKYYRVMQSRDIHSGETMLTREDNMRMVHRPDSSSIAEFADGTRITVTYTPYDDYAARFEKPPEKYVKIECPGFATTIFNTKTSECSLAFADGTLVSCEPKRIAYTLIHKSGELIEIAAGPNGFVSFLPRFLE
jgi:hypothetical protein